MTPRKKPTAKLPELDAIQIEYIREALDDLFLKVEATGDAYEANRILSVDRIFERMEQEQILKH